MVGALIWGLVRAGQRQGLLALNRAVRIPAILEAEPAKPPAGDMNYILLTGTNHEHKIPIRKQEIFQ
jgi:hypothetical protein